MAAVQSVPVFQHPHGPLQHQHQQHQPAAGLHLLPPPGHPNAAALLQADDDDDDDEEEEEEEEEDEGGLPWWLQGHAGTPPPPPPQGAQAQAGRPPLDHHHHHHHGGGSHNGNGNGGRNGGGALGFILYELIMHPLLALARLGSKHKGDHPHHRRHHHGPLAPSPSTTETDEEETAEAEEQEVEEEEEEEEEPAPVLLVGMPRVYSCGGCRTHLASDMDVISRAFQGRGGRAFLLDTVVNVALAPPEDRLLMTGVHTVADVVCAGCRALLGWKYEKAHEPAQRYKEGKFILERARLFHEAEDGEGGAHNEGWLSL